MGSTTYVSSSVYNLAGDVNKRSNFLKTTVVGAVINESDIASTITDSYLHGPGIKLRSFAKWSRTQGYSDRVGLVTGSFYSAGNLNTDLINGQIPFRTGYISTVQKAEVGPADFLRWAEQYMGINYPLEVDSNWIADYDLNTNLIVITRTDGTQVVFYAAGYDAGANYLYVQYNYLAEPIISPVTFGATTYGPFPVLVNPVVVQDTTTNTVVPLVKTTVVKTTWSDATPTTTNTTTENTNASVTNFTRILAESVLVSPRTYEDRTYHLVQTGNKVSNDQTTVTTTNMGGGVTRTTTTTVTTESIQYVRETRMDVVTRTLSKVEATQTLVYARYSGNTILDTMFTGNGSMGTFFPYIPLRIENTFISPQYYPEIYIASKKAVRKATNGNFDKVVGSLAENPQLGDIDFAYMVFGVALNTKENECKRYLYTFFERCAAQSNDGLTFAEWKAYTTARQLLQDAYNLRMTPDENGFRDGTAVVWNIATQTWDYLPLPVVPPYLAPPSYSLNISSGNLPGMNYNINLSWASMALSTGTGLGRTGAKVGELWFEQLADEFIPIQTFIENEFGSYYETYYQPAARIALVFQESANRWRRITILNFIHRNMVYQGNTVTITAKEALNAVEESGFIIPLHEGIFADTPLVSRTQMANSCAYLMLNSYTIVTRKWYQSGFFAILLIVVAIAIVIFYPPATSYLANAGGILGGNIAVGTAIGLSGIAAVLVGAAANAIAAMLVLKIISGGATAIFGAKIGAIIGFVASVYALQAGTMFASGQQFSMASMYTNLMKADNLLKLTFSIGDGVAQYIKAGVQETIGETTKLIADFKTKSGDIAEAFEKEFGVGTGGVINTLGFTDVALPGYEPPEVFLNRTLLTGSDIAQLSLEMISKFAALTLDLDL